MKVKKSYCHEPVTIFLWLKDRVVFITKKSKDLDPSYKMDLDLWDYFGRVELVV